jgi:hypothetical protein
VEFESRPSMNLQRYLAARQREVDRALGRYLFLRR